MLQLDASKHINDLLMDLKSIDHGVAIDNLRFNSFAYADDISVFSSNAAGLQLLIDTCFSYSRKWRFKFGIKKTKCMISGKSMLKREPKWFLGQYEIGTYNELELLGTIFSSNRKSDAHVTNRIRKCRQSYFGLNKCGIGYPGASCEVKTYLWKAICSPVLTYGLDCIDIDKGNLKKLETLQGNLIKQSLGLSKRVHTSNLLVSLYINKISDIIKRNVVSLYNRILKIDSPIKDLTLLFLSNYICTGTLIPGTIVNNIVSLGLSPTLCAFDGLKHKLPNLYKIEPCGHVDSLRALIFNENFMKPYSDEHTLVYLLTKSF